MRKRQRSKMFPSLNWNLQSNLALNSSLSLFIDKIRIKAFSFKTCGEAITAGLEFFQKERYSEALEAFNRSLELPGL